MTLDGKVALVMGGLSGIGASICERLSSEGATVTFTYVQSHDKTRALVDSISASGRRAGDL
jgi:3-oxoacyl-[acyl-carrier protein] reductase